MRELDIMASSWNYWNLEESEQGTIKQLRAVLYRDRQLMDYEGGTQSDSNIDSNKCFDKFAHMINT